MGHSKRSISRRGKRTVEKWIAKLRKTGAFEFVSVVLLKPKPDLPMGADGCVDPFKVLPSHLHDAWRMAVAITQVWAAGMDESHPAVLVQALFQEGPVDRVFNLHGAVVGRTNAVMLGADWDCIKGVCGHLFDAYEEKLLDHWQLGFMKTTEEYPHQTRRHANKKLLKKLHALSLFSPVLEKDLRCLRPWANFGSFRIYLGGVAVCWWVVRVLLLPGPMRQVMAPANPQTLCAARPYNSTLPGVGVAQQGSLTGPMYTSKNAGRKK